MTLLHRGKKKDSEEWVKGFHVHYDDLTDNHKDDCDYIVEKHNGEYFPFREVISKTVGLVSEFIDINNVEICEGDIVLYSDKECYYPDEYTRFIGKVVFEKGAFGIRTKNDLPLNLDWWCANENFVSLWELHWNFNCHRNELPMLEVIGNVYDNPELLEKE